MTSIHEVSTAGGNLIATEAIWRESSNPGVYVLAYAPGDVVRPEDQHLVRKAVPRDKAMRGPREKPKETKETP